MNIEELEFQHLKYDDENYKLHTKPSIEFAISVLNDVILNYNKPLIDLKYGLDKIQELKQYLDE